MEDIEKYIETIGYKGCRNCRYQPVPLKSCEWSKNGGANTSIYVMCPRWDKKDGEK